MFKSRTLDMDSARGRGGRGQAGDSDFDKEAELFFSAGRSNRTRKQIPDEYRTLEHGKKRGWGFLIFLFILFVASAAGYWYWSTRNPQFMGDSVSLKVRAQENIVSGDSVTYVVTYENKDLVALHSAQLDVQWPEGFYYDSSTEKPSTETATTWVLGPMDAGQRKEMTITGQLVGLKDQVQQAVFRLSYRPENISSEFEVSQAVDVRIAEAKLNLELTSPDKVLAGQEVEFKAVLSNTTSETLYDLSAEFILPEDFTLLSADPALTDNRWAGDLPSDKPITVTVKARAVDDAEGSQMWVVEVSQKNNDQQRRLLRKEFNVTPVRPDLGLDLKINGQSTDFDAKPGDTLNYQLKVTNQGNETLHDIKISALMDSSIIDRKTVESNGTAENDTLIWTKQQVEGLGAIEAGKDVIISWKAKLLGQGGSGRSSVDNVVTAEIEGLQGWRKSSPVFIVAVGNGLQFNQNVYWDLGGQQVGSGQLPPVTNMRSVYMVVWSIDSGSQDFDTVNVSTILPPKVTFMSTEEVDEGALRYNEETNRLEWQINNFSSKLLPLKASFFIKFVPVDGDEGSVMTLMNPATLVASGETEFQGKSSTISTAQIITTRKGDFGTVIE